MSRLLLAAFYVITTIHLITLAVEGDASVSKFLLMPTLAAWVLSKNGPKLIVFALLASAVGDIALEFDDLFLVGMGGFAIAHIFYVTYFVRRGALQNRTRVLPMAILVAISATALVVAVWPNLPDLQIPIAIYAALLATTAITSHGVNTIAGLGGILFLASDAILALRMAELLDSELNGLWVMVPYILGQYLLAVGAMDAQERGTPSPQPAKNPH